jgi:hypothetical protein
MNKTTTIYVGETPILISDGGTVGMGKMSPVFPVTRGTPAKISDSGTVRIGNLSPGFPPLRSR